MWRRASLPAVEPGFQPGGQNRAQSKRRWIVSDVLRDLGVCSGRQDAALHVRLGSLPLPYWTERMRQKLFVVASGAFVNTSGPNELAGGGAVYVAAGILARRGAGLPSPADKTARKANGDGLFRTSCAIWTFVPGGRMPPSTAVRDA